MDYLKAVLSKEERDRLGRFRFRCDHDSYLAAHAVQRLLLSELTGQAPETLEFTYNEFGKPELVERPGSPAVRFNLTHTKGMAAMAVAIGFDIGIDVEWMQDGINFQDLSDRHFTRAENDYLECVPSRQRKTAFYRLWTLKEAYVKAVGQGLNCALDSFNLLDIDTVPRLADSRKETMPGWHVESIVPSDYHCIALAIYHGLNARPLICVHAIALRDLARRSDETRYG
ncbi:MAG: 4'-phosphopantetheinyl transferase superfamily protein [Azoarcus sp.]|nr:4'-phosphopantetheinyl transferase superfamily protein [Azoarcus sp.]